MSVSFGRFVLNYYRQVSKSRRLVGLVIGLNGGVFAADYITHNVALRCVALRCVALPCVALRCLALPCFAIALNASKSRRLVELVFWLNNNNNNNTFYF